jgi:hypothetical protein
MATLSPETERLARLVAAQSGKTTEQVLKEAVEAQARVAGVAVPESVRARKNIDMERVRQIVRRVASKPLLDKRTPREIRDEAWGRSG